MRKTLSLFGFVLVVALSSCTKTPIAEFTPSSTTPLSGESITFNNVSSNAESYTWNFGDGVGSTVENPSHAYAASGTYQVTLKAYSKNEKKVDEISSEIVVGATATEEANLKLMKSWDLDSMSLTKPGGPNFYWLRADLWGGTNEYLYVFSTPNVIKIYRDGAEEYAGVYELTSPTEILFDGQVTTPIVTLTETHFTFQRTSANDPSYTETWFFTEL